MLLPHVQLVSWELLVILCQAAFQSAQCIVVDRIIPSQGQSSAFNFFKLHEIPVKPFVQPDEVPRYGSTTISHSFQFSIICSLAEGHSLPSSRSLTKMLTSVGPNISSWDILLVADLQLDFGLLIKIL